MAGKIVVVGSSNIDLIMKMERLPRPGETVTEAEFAQVFGGKGANQAVAAARAGGDVAFVSCVGDDAYGGQVIDNLKKDGIDARHVFQEEGVASGTALIMVDEAGENCISVAPGANYRLTADHVDRARPAIEEAAVVIAQCEILPETLDHVIDTACRARQHDAAQSRPRTVPERCVAGEARRPRGERDRGRVSHRSAGED